MEERNIGEIFEIDGVKLQVVEVSECDYDSGCNGCYYLYDCLGMTWGKCAPCERKDRKTIKYKKVKL